MERNKDMGLVAILHKDPLLPVAAVDLIMCNGDDPPAESNATPNVLTTVSAQSPLDPITTVVLGHHNPPITRLLLPPTYVPYFSSSLTVLSLADNRIDHLPCTIWSLVKLRELNVNHNALKHVSPFIGRLVHLAELHLSHNHLTFLPPLPVSLEVLDVSHNQLPWAPAMLTKLKQLRRLWISDNPMSFSAIGGPMAATVMPPNFPPPALGLQPLSNSLRSHLHPQSLRDLALQAVSVELRHHGLHVYCRHHPSQIAVEQAMGTRHFAKCVARDLRLAGASQDSIDLWLSSLLDPMDEGPGTLSAVRAGAVTWDDAAALADGQLGVYDPYAGQPNGAAVAANIAQVPMSAVDAEFAAMVWSKIKTAARQALRLEWEVVQAQRGAPTTVPVSSSMGYGQGEDHVDAVPPGIDPHSPLGPRPVNDLTLAPQTHATRATLVIDTIKSQQSADRHVHSCPVSPGIREWSAGLPLPTPKASPTGSDSPGTPSYPSPPSAYGSYCIAQVIPSDLLLSLVVPSATCDVCGNGIHRMLDKVGGQRAQQARELRLSAIQNVAGGNLVPVSWTVCGVKCWQTIQGQVVTRVRLGR